MLQNQLQMVPGLFPAVLAVAFAGLPSSWMWSHPLPQDSRSGPEAMRGASVLGLSCGSSSALRLSGVRVWIVLVKLLCECSSGWPWDLMAPGLTEPGTSSYKSG